MSPSPVVNTAFENTQDGYLIKEQSLYPLNNRLI
jgi:hypothetical protein